jgi:tmRNA-binding protein
MTKRTVILISGAIVFALCLTLISSLLDAGEPSGTATGKDVPAGTAVATATKTASTAPPAKPKKSRKFRIYIKGSDKVNGLKADKEEFTEISFTNLLVLQCFELALNSSHIQKKYDKKYKEDGGWKGLREKHGIDFIFRNVQILKQNQNKYKKNADGKIEKVGTYSDAELTHLTDFIVETTATAKLEEISWLKQRILFKYYAEVEIKVTDKRTKKVLFHKTLKKDLSKSSDRVKKLTAAKLALRRATMPLALEVLKLKQLKDRFTREFKKTTGPEKEKPEKGETTPGKADKTEGEKAPLTKPDKPLTPGDPTKPDAPKKPEKTDAPGKTDKSEGEKTPEEEPDNPLMPGKPEKQDAPKKPEKTGTPVKPGKKATGSSG